MGGVVCTVILLSNPTVVLCCVEVGVLTISPLFLLKLLELRIESGLIILFMAKEPRYNHFILWAWRCQVEVACKGYKWPYFANWAKNL